jgi:hypothetical protein
MDHIWTQNEYIVLKTILQRKIDIVNQYKKATCQIQSLEGM